MSTVPHFPLYCPDWLTDTEGMSMEAQGLFMRLLCYCWLREGLPTSERELADLVHMDIRKFKRIWTEIEHKFIETSPELIANLSRTSPELLGDVQETSAELLRDFSKTSLRYWNPRLLKEMLQLADKQKKRRQAGQQGGLAKARNLLGQKSKQNPSKSDPDPYIKEKVEKEKDSKNVAKTKTRASATPTHALPDFEKIKGLNMPAWKRWEQHRKTKRKGKYKTTGIAERLAKLDYDDQMRCVQNSIDLDYQGIFPEDWQAKLDQQNNKRWSGGMNNQPRGGGATGSYGNGTGSYREARPKQELLSLAKNCYAHYERRGTQCAQSWAYHYSVPAQKCHWCEKFERDRNGPAKAKGTMSIGELAKQAKSRIET